MNSCHAPCTLYSMCTSFYTGTSVCRRNLIEACATIGDWAFIFSHVLNTVLLKSLQNSASLAAIISETSDSDSPGSVQLV